MKIVTVVLLCASFVFVRAGKSRFISSAGVVRYSLDVWMSLCVCVCVYYLPASEYACCIITVLAFLLNY